MPQEITHSFILIITIALSFIVPRTNLAKYDLQIAAFLFIVFFISKKIFAPSSSRSRLIESVVFSLVILLIINTTGSINSPFFFLIYFLLFSLALLLEPIISFTSTIALIIFFLLTLPADQGLKQLVPIISLAFLTPFAMFMGQEYLQSEKLKVKSEELQEETFLFLSLMLKNHLKNIKKAVENFIGDHQLSEIRKHAQKMEKLIEEFEKTN
ncbi:hypothetical protein COS31_02960 [Candidatus Roizmanbacteria bacterium CG02_land_8_20_14_3_00_36_15]|uniref:Uncharacterized protein n=2 Tax=Candidatus Roizmaniibacteriota TaxID=1752723 RepID=A0A2M8KL46_9BACT|nr:MAG: hypothetical protein COS51_04690 [Candidatus Roizmanbacteria bacterium CG03_land_8_20_14_0_80_36_21]PIV37758.1 MAG: hypothetical protein COS31_02960 [Candidatus Roizmanbacteria bacterium CG02_land_8_20_14_3_00_36_15]PIY70160.1 MAG: hypothetical protein COY89_02640 [Candidatus Roizmanbacteria bacterium CG_4_10_14_0_8_um_filter_36_36]PJA52902.1 MAG: hypothetical protein CO166_03755 [Candidatus Roizmanbacteria bacterium CG_4_9_14_3_um_filter_36_11]PJC82303.1 MAG: hypothetical protein CO007